MPKITTEFKKDVQDLPVKEPQAAILKFARKDQAFYDFINLQFLNNNEAAEELYEETMGFIEENILFPGDRGVIQKRLKAAIDKCIIQINHYAKVSNNKKGEADLLLLLIETVMEQYADELGTCFTSFDSKLALTSNRLLNLVTKKLHPDYFIEYENDLDRFLRILHNRSNHLNYIYALPQTAEMARE